jgi:hypothetical protein
MDWAQAVAIPQTLASRVYLGGVVMQDAACVREIAWMAWPTTSAAAPRAQPSPPSREHLR